MTAASLLEGSVLDGVEVEVVEERSEVVRGLTALRTRLVGRTEATPGGATLAAERNAAFADWSGEVTTLGKVVLPIEREQLSVVGGRSATASAFGGSHFRGTPANPFSENREETTDANATPTPAMQSSTPQTMPHNEHTATLTEVGA